jgi:hypothetical protein
MAEPSASAVLAFLAAAAAPAAVELLLPMASGRSVGCGNGEVELQEQCARKKTVAAEWDGLFTLPPLFIPPLGIYVRSQPSTVKRKWRADPAVHVSASGHRGVHYAW